MTENQNPAAPVMVVVSLVGTRPDNGEDYDVTTESTARTAVTELLGPDRRIEDVGDGDGTWLVQFTSEEYGELEAHDWFGRDNQEFSIEAEMP